VLLRAFSWLAECSFSRRFETLVVHATDRPLSRARDRQRVSGRADAGGRTRRALTGGGTDGNEQLTTITGIVLVGLLLVIGITILRIQQLISIHLFVGLLLIGPVGLKMASTGYRFLRYYTGDRVYRLKGPPETVLRLIAPIVVLTTVLVFLTGVLLMFAGPAHRNPLLELHKVSFIVWVVFTALHVLGHLPGVTRLFGIDLEVSFGGSTHGGVGTPSDLVRSPGAAGRWIALAGAIVGGIVLAIVLIPDFHTWTAHGVLLHHHDG
jgi:hypothetical protein